MKDNGINSLNIKEIKELLIKYNEKLINIDKILNSKDKNQAMDLIYYELHPFIDRFNVDNTELRINIIADKELIEKLEKVKNNEKL